MVHGPRDENAREYDAQSRQHEWHGPEVLFGLSFELVNAGETLLDIGIGTGLSSIPFHKAGLSIVGIDSSREMLEVCRSKSFARELKEYDVRQTPLPFADGAFDHLISCGVFHFLETLDPLFAEARRLVKDRGLFAFTFEKHKLGSDYGSPVRAGLVSKRIDEDSGVEVFRHSEAYIKGLLAANGFAVLKTIEFVASVHPETGRRVHFRAIAAAKSPRGR